MPISNICHSNTLRAQQTAEIFASSLNLADISEVEYLSPNDDISLIKQNLTLDNALYIANDVEVTTFSHDFTCGSIIFEDALIKSIAIMVNIPLKTKTHRLIRLTFFASNSINGLS